MRYVNEPPVREAVGFQGTTWILSSSTRRAASSRLRVRWKVPGFVLRLSFVLDEVIDVPSSCHLP